MRFKMQGRKPKAKPAWPPPEHNLPDREELERLSPPEPAEPHDCCNDRGDPTISQDERRHHRNAAARRKRLLQSLKPNRRAAKPPEPPQRQGQPQGQPEGQSQALAQRQPSAGGPAPGSIAPPDSPGSRVDCLSVAGMPKQTVHRQTEGRV